MRYALGIEYDGSGFYGWQRQKELVSVQASVEQALSRVANHPVTVVCAGRTDTGVHAHCQVVHFDSDADRNLRSWLRGSNSNLPTSVSILWIRPVDNSFHARFTALGRRYRYGIVNRPIRPALEARTMSWVRQPLDAERMHEAAQALLGEHDFSSFRSSGCKANHPVREIRSIAVGRQENQVWLEIAANGFLYHMVRNIAGSLISIGRGDHEVDWLEHVLKQQDRKIAGVTAAPFGLYFAGVRYPAEYQLPSDYRQAQAQVTPA